MDYYQKLFSLFLRVKGIKRKELKNDRYNITKHFYEWLPIYINQTQEYKQYLINYFGYNLNSSTLAEFDKGYIDSIIDSDSIMISNYAFTNGYSENSNIIFDEKNNMLFVTKDGLYSLDNIDTLITHNPYTLKEENKVEKIFNIFNGDIILGVYGNLNDMDKKSKINHLKKLKGTIKYSEDYYNEKDDNYFYVLTRK